MTDSSSGPRPGARDNGLRCAGYVAAGDLDPRVADALLDVLRAEGIAAYASPTPATQGGYLELKLPENLTDRVYVDSEKAARAMTLFEQEKADAAPAETAPSSSSEELDVDAAWQGLLASLQTPAGAATWPSREDVAAGSPPVTFDASAMSVPSPPEEEDEHYLPPHPPPLPKLRTATVGSLVAILVGIFVLVTNFDGGAFAWVAIAAIIGGGIALVWNVKQGPPTDSGWDDGAVV